MREQYNDTISLTSAAVVRVSELAALAITHSDKSISESIAKDIPDKQHYFKMREVHVINSR